jgi:hypothetical protein
MRVTAYAAYAVAGMFVVFAVWAALGFAFPMEPLLLALNVMSKILCFVAAIMLFVWRSPSDNGTALTDRSHEPPWLCRYRDGALSGKARSAPGKSPIGCDLVQDLNCVYASRGRRGVTPSVPLSSAPGGSESCL